VIQPPEDIKMNIEGETAFWLTIPIDFDMDHAPKEESSMRETTLAIPEIVLVAGTTGVQNLEEPELTSFNAARKRAG
jgi:hypothetical protein